MGSNYIWSSKLVFSPETFANITGFDSLVNIFNLTLFASVAIFSLRFSRGVFSFCSMHWPFTIFEVSRFHETSASRKLWRRTLAS